MELKDVLDLGLTGVLGVAVIALWKRLNSVTDTILKSNAVAEKKLQKIVESLRADAD